MTQKELIILGIESTCDETAAAVVRRDSRGRGEILSNVVRAQTQAHAPYGGVVPEIAARAHVEAADRVIALALRDAGLEFGSFHGVAAAAGPGLIGGVIVGLTTAKAISLVHGLPLASINHLEAHALTARLTDGIAFPYLLLLVSGGHTQLLWVEDVGRYQRLGTTIDDALGEAFDKVAKLLGLGFPGGPEVERMAALGDPRRFTFPRPMQGRSDPHFSFSGLKTAVRLQAEHLDGISTQDVADICASFQRAVCESVADRVARAINICKGKAGQPLNIVVSGGVAANAALSAALSSVAANHDARLVVPPPALCTDNGAMIAWAGAERLARGLFDSLHTSPRARWPLDPEAAPAPGAGVKA